jgi:hypothetical protein
MYIIILRNVSHLHLAGVSLPSSRWDFINHSDCIHVNDTMAN